MILERVELFNRKDALSFALLSLVILSYSLLIEFQSYKQLTRYDYALIDAKVLSQYTKTKNSRTYQVLKLKSEDGITFYTGAKKSQPDIKEKKIKVKIYASDKSFYEYLSGFYAYSRIMHVYEQKDLKQTLNSYIASKHKDSDITNIYQALFSAQPLSAELHTIFSTLGVSHLLAISGFHLGVLSALLFFLLKHPYRFLQDRYFPYRNASADIFMIISLFLFSYLLFLDSPPSLLRAFAMLVIGFILYDRGIKIISMQTLLLSAVILLCFFPRLLFSIGFWLSISGVFYIFLFLIHFKHLNKVWQFVLVPFWVYILMLPYSLNIFGEFSIYHPLSILWTSLFSIFYPLGILLHLVGFADLFDPLLNALMDLAQDSIKISLGLEWLVLHILISLICVFEKKAVPFLVLYGIFIFTYAFYPLI